MAQDTKPANLTLARALHLVRAGFLVFPCRPGRKTPATRNGVLDATIDEAQIRAWFDNDHGFNLAVACGPQPNGINLLAIDVDPLKGGDKTWSTLTSNGHELPPCPIHTTRSGGWHLFYDAPAGFHSTAGRLGVGIDTRGVGGYVVVPPSRVADPDSGEIGTYTTQREQALSIHPVPPLPDWLIEMLTDDDGRVISRHPSQQVINLGDSPADLLRSRWDWATELDRRGWTLAGRRGDEERWRRPGKPLRDGHSAVVHPGPNGDPGVLVRFTTEGPLGGVPTRNGEALSFSPYDFVKAYDFGGDDKATVAWIRGVPVTSAAATGLAPGTGGNRDADGDVSPLFPPPEFYDARPWLSACRQMAQASGISPAAMVLAYLTRWATLIPPGFSIPAINGARSSFDLIGVVAGTSGSGKSSVMMRAEEMLPVLRKDLRMGLGIGSGEGVIEAFYDWIKPIGEDGKPKPKERVKAIAGVHFAIDEGLILAELTGRAGTTHNTRLQTAWSGAPLSTANSSADTFRHIDSGQYRLTAMMAIQVDLAHELMTEKAASAGFVGRLLFAWAEEPSVRPRPDEPDPFKLDVPASIMSAGRFTRQVLTYPQAIWDELIDRHDARRGTVVPVEEHHHDLLRLKAAGVFSLMDGCRMAVSMEDWALATTLTDCSAAVRRHLYAHRRQQQGEKDAATAIAVARREIVRDEFKEQQTIKKLADRIHTRVTMAGTRGVARGRLRADATTGEYERGLFTRALGLAVANEWVRMDGHRAYAI